MFFTYLLIAFLASTSISQADRCSPRYFNYNSFVCVCNSTYCDSLDIVQPESIAFGSYVVYTTSNSKHRLNKSKGNLKINSKTDFNGRCSGLFSGVSLCIDLNKQFQTIVGFGGSFTDAAGINIYSLSNATRQHLITSYFSASGLEYNLGRVPIGGSDFSTRPYTYDDNHKGDFKLAYFKLQEEDFIYKIPLIKEAQKMMSRNLTLIASPWSAPAWMKTNNKINGAGVLKGTPGGKYYSTWANYFVRFLQEYDRRGIQFWVVTAQNEPIDGFIPFFTFNSMGFTPKMQRIFVNNNLGPALTKAGYGNIGIYVVDDNRPFLLPYMVEIMKDPLSEKYVSGAALHWYLDHLVPSVILDVVHDLYPSKPLLMTEASFLHLLPVGDPVQLGNWDRAEEYAEYVIQNLNHWVTGWVDWNLAVDLEGGPNWAKFNLEGTVIVNKTSDEFYKQPIYYIIGHFSKFAPPGSQRISAELSWLAKWKGLSTVAFKTPTDSVAVIILNRSDKKTSTNIFISGIGSFSINVPEKSIQTYVMNMNLR